MTTETMHPFERAGLGKAPFRFTGLKEQDLCHGEAILNRDEYERTGIKMTTKPGGSCDYCGTYIVVMCGIESSDGKRFKVGSDCACKVDDKPLTDKVKCAVNKRRAAIKKVSNANRIAAAKALMPSVAPALQQEPHPKSWRAEKGETLYDWCAWMFKNAGNTGMIRAARKVERAAASVV